MDFVSNLSGKTLLIHLQNTLQTAINLKEDKTKVTELLSALENKLNDLINLKANTTVVNEIKKNLEAAINLRATTEYVNSMKSELNNLINQKANQVRTITGGGSLTGGGDLSTDRVISHKTSSGHKHIPSGGATNQFLKYSADGTAVWAAIAWEVITGKTSITVGNGLTGGGNIGSNINIGLEILSDSEVDTLLTSYKK